jgi:hypothetical protein
MDHPAFAKLNAGINSPSSDMASRVVRVTR